MTDLDLLDAQHQAEALLADAAEAVSLREQLAAAHAQLGEWREAVVAANRISQEFEARALRVEAELEEARAALSTPADAPATAGQKVGICNVESTVGHHCLLSSGHAGQHQDRHGNTWPAPAEQEVGRAPVLTADDVEWVVNDIAELGVKIGAQFFFLYKGNSLVYDGTHDDGRPMRWRPVYKMEFGECCHPWEFRYGQFNLSDDSLACWMAQSGDWKIMPAPPPRPDEDGGRCRNCQGQPVNRDLPCNSCGTGRAPKTKEGSDG